MPKRVWTQGEQRSRLTMLPWWWKGLQQQNYWSWEVGLGQLPMLYVMLCCPEAQCMQFCMVELEVGGWGMGCNKPSWVQFSFLTCNWEFNLNGSVCTYPRTFFFFFFCGNGKPVALSQVIPVVSLEQYQLLPVSSRLSVEWREPDGERRAFWLPLLPNLSASTWTVVFWGTLCALEWLYTLFGHSLQKILPLEGTAYLRF